MRDKPCQSSLHFIYVAPSSAGIVGRFLVFKCRYIFASVCAGVEKEEVVHTGVYIVQSLFTYLQSIGHPICTPSKFNPPNKAKK